ncbi:glycoside hydrolase domain-containing protein [Cutibacterium sp.]|uniref:glycoside hydrolase domain-containing protein n=1 Tax=Cutibacterium sp. TaxID=1912221 RepID=UPI0026DBF1DB|nr:glycoside hydrolase domain-containing protein [Cutibacterium sp.]MDO4413205.1 DUF1906 domain-containing protein [Cutibacterium sp.]
MSTALIQVLQAIEGFTPAEATGNFGDGTRSRLQTISSGTSEWVWLASVALLCNGYSTEPVSTWNDALATLLRRFQSAYAIPVTGAADPTTWMSLLTFKGDPNRACIACDTRFEITDELAEHLKADGYQIVGRYLSEPGQESLLEDDYFKALRTGELERIVRHGLKYFPIFQEYSTKLRYFTPETGARHAKEAQATAQRLGIPSTVIYFAVDYDATDPEIDSNMIPYFRAVSENLGGGYRVGIYASRNICTRIAQGGYSVASFVSDMSTGFSGNLGFPIPDNWAFDQFHEISGYREKWDLDRVAYSGRVSAVSTVKKAAAEYSSISLIDLIEALENRFDEMRSIYADYGFGTDTRPAEEGTIKRLRVPTWHCILNHLAKSYLKDGVRWALSVEPSRKADASRLESDPIASEIIAALNKWIDDEPELWQDPYGGSVDVAHMTVTTLGYVNMNPLVADKWTGWAGDLASALGYIQKIVDMNPNSDPSEIAKALVGQGDDYKSHEGLQGLKLPDVLRNNCNYSDLCSDGDAISFAAILEDAVNINTHLLSQTMRGYYYNPVVLSRRFKRISESVGANDLESAKKKFYSEIDGNLDNRYVGVLTDGYDGATGYSEAEISQSVKQAACDALAEFIY